MSSTPPSSDSMFDSLNIQGSTVGTPLKSDPPPPKGEFQSLSLGIASPAGISSGGLRTSSEGSVQVLPGVTIGISVAYITEPEKLCCGQIGNSGTKFCIKTKDCTTTTHVLPMRKHAATRGLYILDKRSNGCLINPVLDPTNLDESVILRLLDTEGEPEDLRNEFVLIASQDGSKDSEIDEVARKTFLKTVNFKTPSKSKGQMFRSGGTNLVDIVSNFTTTSDEASGQTKLKFETTEDMSLVVSDLVKYYEGLKRILPSMAGTVDSLGDSLNDKTDLIYGGIQQVRQLEGTIGKQPQELKEKNTAPTIWGSISELFSNFQKSDADFTTKVELLKGSIDTLEGNLNQYSKSTESESLKADIFKLLTGWKGIIEGVTSRVTNLENHSSSSRSSSIKTGAFESLGINDNNTSDPNNSSQTMPASVSELLNSLTSRLGKIERQQTDSGKEGLSGAVRFSGVTFTSKEDVGAWLDSHLITTGAVPPYGLFADPQLLLHWVWILLSGSTSSSARDMKDRISIEMSQDKTYAVDSYQHYIPLVFTGKKSSLLNTGGMDKSRLAQIPSFESWDDATGETGLKQQIAEGLAMVRHSISDLIEENFSNSPEVRAFALGMLNTSSSFIESLGTYMSETYNNFKDVVGNEKSVWGLVTFVVEQLFRKDFAQVRAKTIGAIDANNRTSGIKIIWSSIKCVDVAQQFMSQGIKNAPSVSASYVRFVITHSNMGKVSNILEDNKKLKRKIDDLETSIESIKKVAEGAKRVADQAMSKAASSAVVKKKKKTETGDQQSNDN
jgi:hypothetical protein